MTRFLATCHRVAFLVFLRVSILYSPCDGYQGECTRDNVNKIVDCSNLNLTSVPRDLPSDTTMLNLTNNRLVSLNSSDFENLTDLKTLEVNSNFIKSIGDGTFANLQNLTKLSLGENSIESIKSDTFEGAKRLEILILTYNQDMLVQPATFQSIPNLRNLELHGTTFVENYDFSNLSNLEVLTVSNCSLTELDPTHFQAMENLKTFSAHHNFIRDIAFVKEFPNLEEIFLYDNQIREVPTRSFEMNSKLDSISLRRNEITSLASESLSGVKNNTHVHLEENEIETFASDIFDELTENETLRLYLADNPINCNQGMKWMASFHHKNIFERTTCSSPDCVEGRDITTLVSCEFDCDISASSDGHLVLGLIVALAVTSLLLVSLGVFVCFTSYRKSGVPSRYSTLNELTLT